MFSNYHQSMSLFPKKGSDKLKLFIICIAFSVGVVIDPFSLSSVTSAYSQEIVQRAIAPFYITHSNENENEMPDVKNIPPKGVTVILIDDQYIDKVHKQGWPIPYFNQNLLIERIARLQPRAIFVDVIYSSQRKFEIDGKWCHDDEEKAIDANLECYFESLSRTSISKNVPIILADSSKNFRSKEPESSIPIDVNNYKGLSSAWVDQYESNGGYRLARSPALKLYDYCDENNSNCEKISNLEQAIYPVWGVYSDEYTDSNYSHDCLRYDPALDFFDKMALSVHFLLVDFWSKLYDLEEELQKFRDCSAVTTIPATRFMLLSSKEIKPFLENRLVIVGTHGDKTNDTVDTSVAGNIPGALLHAMVLDNLLNYGNDQWRESSSVMPNKVEVDGNFKVITYTELTVIIIGVLILWYSFMLRLWAYENRQGYLYNRSRILYGYFFLVILVLITVLAFSYLRIAILNWVGILFLLFIVEWYMHYPVLELLIDWVKVFDAKLQEESYKTSLLYKILFFFVLIATLALLLTWVSGFSSCSCIAFLSIVLTVVIIIGFLFILSKNTGKISLKSDDALSFSGGIAFFTCSLPMFIFIFIYMYKIITIPDIENLSEVNALLLVVGLLCFLLTMFCFHLTLISNESRSLNYKSINSGGK